MANFESIVQWLLYQEDDHRVPGKIVNLNDGAGLTRLGITQRWHQQDVPTTFFSTMSFTDAVHYSKIVYRKSYWGFIDGDLIADAVAAPLLSFAVNGSISAAVKNLQRVLEVHDDGVMGPATLSVLNTKDPDITAKLFRAAWEQFYRHLVDINPSKHQFLNQWLVRVQFPYPSPLVPNIYV